MGRGRRPDEHIVALVDKLKKLINEKPMWGKELKRKVKAYYEEKNILLDDKKAINKVENIVKKLKKDHQLQIKKSGRETLYYFPNQEEEAKDIIIEKEGNGEDEIKLSKKFLPVIKKWIEELPNIDEDGFGVYVSYEKGTIHFSKKGYNAIASNFDRTLDVDSMDTENNRISLPFHHGEVTKIQVEQTPLFKELLKNSKTLNMQWNRFTKKSVELWGKIDALKTIINKMTTDELDIPLGQAFATGIEENSFSGWLASFLLKILFYDITDNAETLLLEIWGVDIKKKRIFLEIKSLFIWDGYKFAKTQMQPTLSSHKGSEEANELIYRIQKKGIICLSRKYIADNLGKYGIYEQLIVFDEFCNTHVNNIIGKIRKEPVFQEAKEIYKVQQKLWEIYRELKDTLKNKITSKFSLAKNHKYIEVNLANVFCIAIFLGKTISVENLPKCVIYMGVLWIFYGKIGLLERGCGHPKKCKNWGKWNYFRI